MVKMILLALIGLAALVVITFPIHVYILLIRKIRASRMPSNPKPTPSPAIIHFAITAIICIIVIAIPQFLKFNCPPWPLKQPSYCKQSEVKTNLGAIYVAQLSYFSSANTYAGGPDVFHLINWEPAGQNRYAYYCSHDLIPNKIIWKSGFLPMPNRDWPVETKPASSQTGFTCMAIGNIDKDETLDVWAINDSKILRNEVNDVQK